MRDVIQKVLEAEKQARELVESARTEAAATLAAARKQAEERQRESAERTEAEAQHMAAVAVAAARQQQRDLLARAEAGLARRLKLEDAVRREAVDAVVRCVCGLGTKEGD